MARVRRKHVPGGIYYVILHSNEGREVFEEPADYDAFTQLVERCLRRTRARVHAFCWTRRAVRFAIEISNVPLGRIVQQLAGIHARAMNRKRGQYGHVFEQRYWAVLIVEQHQLPLIVRHIHTAPLRARLVSDLSNYAFSSHRTYLGYAKVPWVTMSSVFRALETTGQFGRQAYRELMQNDAVCFAQPIADLDVWNQSRRQDAEFLQQFMPRRLPKSDPELLDRILDSVASKLAVPREDILSPSRRRNLTLARALVVWHATRNEVATLSEVARRFDRNPSTLCAGLDRYRETRSDLFNESIHELLDQ